MEVIDREETVLHSRFLFLRKYYENNGWLTISIYQSIGGRMGKKLYIVVVGKCVRVIDRENVRTNVSVHKSLSSSFTAPLIHTVSYIILLT